MTQLNKYVYGDLRSHSGFVKEGLRAYWGLDKARRHLVICAFNRWQDQIFWEFEMAKKSNRNSQFFNTQFVNVRLDKKEIADFKKWYQANLAEAEVFLHDFIVGGWKMSVRWDDENDCFIVAHTCIDDESPNHNFCMTSRSDVLVEAMLLNYWKFAIFLDGQVHTAATPDNWG